MLKLLPWVFDDDYDIVVADDYDNCILSKCIKYIKI